MTAPFEALAAQGRAWMAVYPAGTRACVFVTWPAGRGSRAPAREFTAGHVIDAVHAADPGPAGQLSFDLKTMGNLSAGAESDSRDPWSAP